MYIYKYKLINKYISLRRLKNRLQSLDTSLGSFSLPEPRPQRDDGCMSEDTISGTGTRILSVPHLEKTGVVYVGNTEMVVPCPCEIHGRIHQCNNRDVVIAISSVCVNATCIVFAF